MLFNRTKKWSGESRDGWEFRITKNDRDIPDAGGIYIMVRRTCFFFTTAVYIGKAANLKSRLIGHERWIEARKHGARERHILCVRTESKRQKIEEDLIRRYKPKLNTIHKPSSDCDAPNNPELARNWMCAKEYWSLNDPKPYRGPRSPSRQREKSTSAKDYWASNDKAA